MPIRVGDEVKINRGGKKDSEGKVVQVYRKRYLVHVERVNREKSAFVRVRSGLTRQATARLLRSACTLPT